MIDGEQYAAPGDLGRLEPDGTVTLIGRGTSVINTGGEKVYPGEVEEVLNELEGVEECLVMGVPDGRFGQLVAALVKRGGDGKPDASDVTAAARHSLAGYKSPGWSSSSIRCPGRPTGRSTTWRPGRCWRPADDDTRPAHRRPGGGALSDSHKYS